METLRVSPLLVIAFERVVKLADQFRVACLAGINKWAINEEITTRGAMGG